MSDPLPFNFRTLETFVAVIDCGGMTAAARKLGWSQSAVSQTIAALEREIGCCLIERRGRQIVLSPAGDLFYQQAASLLGQAKQLVNWIDNSEGIATTSLRIGMVDSFASTAGAGLVRRLEGCAQQIRVRSGIAPYLMESFQQGDLDIIVTMGPITAQEDNIVVRILMESYLLALPVSYGTATPRLDQLCNELPMIRFSSHTPSGLWTDNYLKRFGLRSTSSYEFDSASTVLSMVREGVGWSLVTPLCIAQAPEHSAHIRFSRLSAPGYFRELVLIARQDISNELLDKVVISIRQQLEQVTLPLVQRYVPSIDEREFQIA